HAVHSSITAGLTARYPLGPRACELFHELGHILGTANGPGDYTFQLDHEPQPPALGSWPRPAAGGSARLQDGHVRDAHGPLEPDQASQSCASIARGWARRFGCLRCQMGHIWGTTGAFREGRPDGCDLGRSPGAAMTLRAATETIRGVIRRGPAERSEWSGA